MPQVPLTMVPRNTTLSLRIKSDAGKMSMVSLIHACLTPEKREEKKKNWGCLVSVLILLLLRGTIVNRTYGTHQNLYIYLFLPSIFGPINYGPP